MNILEVTGLEKSYGKFKAVRGIDFHVKKGEIMGFIGPNGSGKTTTLKVITNLIWPNKGKIVINGFDLMQERNKAISCVAGIIESPGLYQNLTGIDNLKFIADMRKVEKAHLNYCKEITDLGRHLKRKVHKYSMGMKQRLALGMSLLTKPELLILDEPTSGLDPTGVLELRDILSSLGCSILFSSHQLSEVENLAHRIIFIKQGLLIKEYENTHASLTDYILHVSNSEKSITLLTGVEGVYQTTNLDNNRINVRLQNPDINSLLSCLYENEIKVLDIEKTANNIEAIYKELYRNSSISEVV